MSKLAKLFFLTMFGFNLSACNPFSGAQDTSSNNSDPSTISITLRKTNSNQELEAYLKHGLEQQSASYFNVDYYSNNMVMDTAPMTSSSNTGNSDSVTSALEATSSTNLWERGVDEADRIKSNGQYLFMMETAGNYFYPMPAPMVFASSTDVSSSPSNGGTAGGQLRVLQLGSSPNYPVTEVSRLSLPWYPADVNSSLYLRTKNEGSQIDLLAALGGASNSEWQNPWMWQQGETQLQTFNVDSPSSPQLLAHYSFDGYQLASRRIDQYLYLALSYTPTLSGFIPYPMNDQELAQNQQLVAQASLDQLLPKWRLDGVEQGVLANANNCYLVPSSTTDYYPNLITVMTINLDQPGSAPNVSCVTGQSQTLYLSNNALYLANPAYNYSDNSSHTSLHKFGLSNGIPIYLASGQIGGTIGWGDKAASHLSELNGDLRVVSSSVQWNTTGIVYDHRLTILREENGGLSLVSQLPNDQRMTTLGKPGEDIYAVRFNGDKLYVVTFMKTDPLYVIDLSDPLDPKIAGELQIPGYSDYLHPIDDHLLLGIGKEAILDSSGSFSWYQGIKLGLFDISDVSDPIEIRNLTIGKRGSDATILYDHHGLSYVPPSAVVPGRLALPINFHDSMTPLPDWEWHPWVHSGLYLFDIHDGQRGAIDLIQQGVVVATNALDSTSSWWIDDIYNDRSLLSGDGVFYLHGNSIWSADWNSPDQINGPQ